MKTIRKIRIIALAAMLFSFATPGFSQSFPTGGYQGGSYGRGGVDGTSGTGMTAAPGKLALQVYPNPFAGETSIRITLENESQVSISLFSIDGRKIRTFLPEGRLPAGVHTVTWDGRDERGNRMATGLYLLRVEANRRVVAGKIALISW